MEVPIENLPITGGIFDDIKEKDPEKFNKFVADSFRSHAKWARFVPNFGGTESLFSECHQCYREDIKKLKEAVCPARPIILIFAVVLLIG